MKKIICIILSIIFFILGIIGLCIPVVPQIPFFLAGAFFMALASKTFKKKITQTEFYQKNLKDEVAKHKILDKTFNDEL